MSKTRLILPPLSLYIHIPWCLKKCPYCDFNSHAYEGELPEKPYIDNLLADLKSDLPYVQGRELVSIFIGGGTPSLFSPASISRLLSDIEKLIPFSKAIEITMEANPGTFEINKFKGFRSAGINRLSIGIQSFDKAALKALGRVHDDAEAKTAAKNVRAAGFENFNLDLMFGLPDQSIKDALADLDIALQCEPPHLSWYQLTIEPNTVFYSQPPQLPEDDLVSEMQDRGIELLAAHNLSRYEISAFCRADKASTHNLNYWRFGDYLGIGAGAHGKVTLPGEQRIMRTRKTRQPAKYLANRQQIMAGLTEVSVADLPLEFMMNALRLVSGSDEMSFEQRTGLSINSISSELTRLRESGLLGKDALATTDRGYKFLNNVLAEFLPADDQTNDRIPLHAQ
ncbi:MAG: putative oxygen-independent coproporphyrinogen III oxidase [Pseudohongiellaceae bacterium]|jgi:putative oxygen-independent coproporphyrinogen III oxidase